MALIYPSATLTPPKLELLYPWVQKRPWFSGHSVERIAAYRFDDPAGEVGIEGFVLRGDDGTLLHELLTYRPEALAGAEAWLVGTAVHSVLGPRWFYDAAGDPVGLTALATTVATGARQAEVHRPESPEPVPPAMTIRGSGTPGAAVGGFAAVTSVDEGPVTVVRGGAQEVLVVRVIGESLPGDASTLTGEWPGGSGVLAGLRPA